MHPMITRVEQRRWHAADDAHLLGRAETSRRPDGRTYVTIDAWDDAVFDRLAEAMLADLPRPLYTVVGQADLDLTSCWRRAGFTTGRGEREYVVPTDPRVTALGSVLSPDGVTIAPAGTARERPLREVYDAVRADIDPTVGWAPIPADAPARNDGAAPLDPSEYVVAAQGDQQADQQGDHYVGLVRVATRTRRPRIGPVAVRPGLRRHGIARALLAQALGPLHRAGADAAWALVDESNDAATALFESVGARPAGGNLELVLH